MEGGSKEVLCWIPDAPGAQGSSGQPLAALEAPFRPWPMAQNSCHEPPLQPPFRSFVTFRDRDLFRRDLFCGSGFFAFGVFRVGCPFVVKTKRNRDQM